MLKKTVIRDEKGFLHFSGVFAITRNNITVFLLLGASSSLVGGAGVSRPERKGIVFRRVFRTGVDRDGRFQGGRGTVIVFYWRKVDSEDGLRTIDGKKAGRFTDLF